MSSGIEKASFNSFANEQLKKDLIESFSSFNKDNETFALLQELEHFVIMSSNQLRYEKISTEHQFLIGRDAIVAVVKTSNPKNEAYANRGLKMSSIETGNYPEEIFATNDVLRTLNQQFHTSLPLGMDNTTLADLFSHINSNKNAIVLCNLSDLKTYLIHYPEANLQIIPIDRNNNGIIDPQEDFYSSSESLENALWVGKYPRSLTSNLYLISNEAQLSEASNNFVQWVLINGQDLVASKGFTNPKHHEQLAQMKLMNSAAEATTTTHADNGLGIVVLFLLGLFALGFIVTLFLQKRRTEKNELPDEPAAAFTPQSISAPEGLLYDKTHTWAFLEKNGQVTVGLDDFFRKILGKADRIETSKPGTTIKKGDVLASFFFKGKKIQIKASVSGIVNETNPDTISMIQSSDMSQSWICKIQPSNWRRETDFMVMADQYRQWIKQEFTRMKDFLAEVLSPNQAGLQQIILQDGGELKTGCLQELEPQAWEEFETMFL